MKSKKSVKQKSRFARLLGEMGEGAMTFGEMVARTKSHAKKEREKLAKQLDAWAEEKIIERLPDGQYRLAACQEEWIGKVDHVNPRFAFVVLQGAELPDVYVKTRDLQGAIHGDIVVAQRIPSVSKTPEGKVVRVEKRGRTRFAGRVDFDGKQHFIVPDSKYIYHDFLLRPDDLNNARQGDKVVFEVTDWGDADLSPEARVIEKLGKTGENNAEIHSIMTEFELPLRFPKAALAEAEQISAAITPQEIAKRKDFRPILTFTIDPEDAKDFDDAISFRALAHDRYEVGVHIADVTHYVLPDTALESDAYERATSVYLVDRTVPMLPERLSNDLCSLKPNEDKLTFAAVFEIDARARVQQVWIGRTIIHSDRRLTYEQAQDLIETKQGDLAAELGILNGLAIRLRETRFSKGAVNFETTEVKFKLDAEGKPLAIIPKIRKDAHKLIEEFMLLANEAVATYVHDMVKGKNKNTFVYRSHDMPDPQKVQDFSLFAKQFGHKLDTETERLAASLNRLMSDVEGKPEQNVLQSLAVRAMAKAKYTTEPLPHFGLAFKHYSHFTSPIRRYPDMMTHRLLQHYLDQGASANKKEYEEKCVHASEREKRAAEAERASIKYKQVEYMSQAVDKIYDGIISGVTDFGIFVEIVETKCEGMARLSAMKDDFYEYDESRYRVIGRRRKKIYQLGDAVTVRIKKTDIDRRLIDLSIVAK